MYIGTVGYLAIETDSASGIRKPLPRSWRHVMGISRPAEVEDPYRLFTAAGFGAEKPGVDALLNHARDLAYNSDSVTNIKLNDKRQAVVESTTDGHKDKPMTVDFSDGKQFVGLRMGMDYNFAASSPGQNQEGHIALSKGLLGGSNYKFDVQAAGKIIEGQCQMTPDLITCTETIKDASGNLLLKGVSTSDMVKNINDFRKNTEYTGVTGVSLGKTYQHFLYDDKANTLRVESATRK